jgi:hypothetical protein
VCGIDVTCRKVEGPGRRIDKGFLGVRELIITNDCRKKLRNMCFFRWWKLIYRLCMGIVELKEFMKIDVVLYHNALHAIFVVSSPF